MHANLECTKCGAIYYSASPTYAAGATQCENGCGATIEIKGDVNGNCQEARPEGEAGSEAGE